MYDMSPILPSGLTDIYLHNQLVLRISQVDIQARQAAPTKKVEEKSDDDDGEELDDEDEDDEDEDKHENAKKSNNSPPANGNAPPISGGSPKDSVTNDGGLSQGNGSSNPDQDTALNSNNGVDLTCVYVLRWLDDM
jgi:hypothetical protein